MSAQFPPSVMSGLPPIRGIGGGGEAMNEFIGAMYFNEGLEYARAGKYDKTILRMNEVIKVYPSRPEPLIILAKIALYRGEIAKCRLFLDRASTKQGIDQKQIKAMEEAIEDSLDRQEKRDFLMEEWRIMVGDEGEALSPKHWYRSGRKVVSEFWDALVVLTGRTAESVALRDVFFGVVIVVIFLSMLFNSYTGGTTL